MRYFLDTEFAEEPGSIRLISIALVADPSDGREFYAVALDGWEAVECNEFVQREVLPHLAHSETGQIPWMSLREIRMGILELLRDDPDPEFWGYFADYDWVVFCWLFGRMVDLPGTFPKWCRDVKQLADAKGVQRMRYDLNQHNALLDAREIRDNYHWLMEIE